MPTLGEIMKGKPLYFVNVGMTVYEVIEYMSSHDVGAVPVLEGDTLVGIFSERDLMTRCVAKKINPENVRVEQVMTKRVVLMEPNDSYEECLQIMKQENIRHVPIKEGDKLVGVVSMRDLMQLDLEEKEQKIEILHSYIHYNPKGKTE